MSFFKVTITGVESFQQEVEKEFTHIETQIPKALELVGSEMIANLQKHIKEDWYEAWGKPKVYERRTDNPNLGTPLGSKDNMDYEVKDDSLYFVYIPSGEHQNSQWSTTSGDDLIRIIQKNHGWKYKPSTDSQNRRIMPRPFWDNFVDEQIHSGIINSFIKGMGEHNKVMSTGRDVIADGTENLE